MMTLVAMLETERESLFLADMLASGTETEGLHPVKTPISFLRTGEPLDLPFSGFPVRKVAIPRRNVLFGFAGSLSFGRKILEYLEDIADLSTNPSFDELVPHADWIQGESDGNQFILAHFDVTSRELSVWHGLSLSFSCGNFEGLAIGSGAVDLINYLITQRDNVLRKGQKSLPGTEIALNCISNFTAGQRIAGSGLADDQRYGGGFELVAFDGTGFEPVGEVVHVVGILRVTDEGILWVRGLTTVTYYEQGFPVTVSTSGRTHMICSVPDARGRRVAADERLISPSVIVAKFTTDDLMSKDGTYSSRAIYGSQDFKPTQFEITIHSDLTVERIIDEELLHRMIRDAVKSLRLGSTLPIASHN